MSIRKSTGIAILLAAMTFCGWSRAGTTPTGTSFTYQGMLKQDGLPANGAYHLRFQLWDAQAGGTQVGADVDQPALAVSDGLFTAELDFGTLAFTGSARWLQVQVITNGGNTVTTLVPRQTINAAPYALFASNAEGQNLTNLNATNIASGTLSAARLPSGGSWPLISALNIDSNTLAVDPVANAIGIGTPTPAVSVHVRQQGPVMVLQDTASNANQAGYVAFWNSSGAETGWVGFGTAGSPDMSIVNTRGNLRLIPALNAVVSVERPALFHNNAQFNGIAQFNGESRFDADARFNGDTGFFSLYVTTNPLVVGTSFDLGVVGTAGKTGGGSWSVLSDRRLKKDIQPLQGSLERMLALRGVNYEYIDPESIGELRGTRVGMVAQEVEKVFPDWIDNLDNGYKSLTFRGFEALTVEALRDLRAEKNAELQSLRAEVAELKALVLQLKSSLKEGSRP